MSSHKIAILTFVVGADYTRAVEPGLQTKREYAARHGYTFLEGQGTSQGTSQGPVWDRRRPIPWSKIRFILAHLDDYDFLFWSDADVIITNPTQRLEDVFGIAALPDTTHMVWCRDACGNLNNGNVLFRGKSPWVRDFLQRAYAQTDLIHHGWWDNAAFIRLFESNAEDRQHIQTRADSWRFNAYLFNRRDDACGEPGERLYQVGDFLVHFAGVYDALNIHRMMLYVRACATAGVAPDTALLNEWRRRPPMNYTEAVQSVPGQP